MCDSPPGHVRFPGARAPVSRGRGLVRGGPWLDQWHAVERPQGAGPRRGSRGRRREGGQDRPGAPAMNIRVGVATDIGLVREGNEDSYLVVAPLYAVADGMGGHRGGEVASSLALETVQRLFEQQEGSLADQVVQANRAVYDRSQSDRSVSGMGTTLTAALIDDDKVHLVHVGDSRAYLLRKGKLTQLTED